MIQSTDRHQAYKLAVLAFAGAVVTAIACSNAVGGPGPGGRGLCTGSCPKVCTQDSDCPTGSGLCCDFGKYGKACTSPQQCAPARFCTDDSKCNTQQGETCCAANQAALDQKICAPAASCQKKCANDNECAGGPSPKCCTLYAQPICTSAQSCPNACTKSTECNAANNETCCTAVKTVYKDIIASNVAGICFPQGYGCPKACTQSTDCNTAGGELCCDGFCATSCAKACDTSDQCETSRGQLCCHAAALASPWYH